MKHVLLSLLLIPFFSLNAKENEENLGMFSGRISRVNERASLIRVKVEFHNFRYVNKKDVVEFWNLNYPLVRCTSYVVGKTNDYMLLKVPEFRQCKANVGMATGIYLRFFSQDLVNNLKMGDALLKILLKKRLAIAGKVNRYKKDLDTYIEKANLVSRRFQLLRDKLDEEWRTELAALEEDRTDTLKNYMQLKVDLDELDRKLEQYRIDDKNLVTDRWSLDPRYYFKK